MNLGPKRIDQFPEPAALTGNEYLPLQYGDKTLSTQIMKVGDFLVGSAPINGAVQTAVDAAEQASDDAAYVAGVLPNLLTKPEASASDGATKVGTPEGTVQDALDGRVKTTELAAPAALAAYGYPAVTVQKIFDNAVPVSSYAQITGDASRAVAYRVLAQGLVGDWEVDPSDTSSASNSGTILVRSSDGARVKRLFDGPINVLWFGADRTGIASSVAAFNAAIALANATQNITIFVPFGKYNLRAGLTQKITGDGIEVVSDNALIYSASGRIFDFDSGAQMRRCRCSGFYFQYDFPTVDVNATPIRASKVLYFKTDNINLQNAPAAALLVQCSNFEIDKMYGDVANIARNTIELQSCVVGAIDNISTITGAGLQPLNPSTPFPNPPAVGCNFIAIKGSTDTIRFGSKVLSNRYFRGLHVLAAPGDIFLNVSFDHPVFDYCFDKSIFVENTGGSISNISFIEPYCQAAGGTGAVGIGIHVKQGAIGLTQAIRIIRPFVFASGSDGIFIESPDPTAARDIVIDKPNVKASNRLGAGGIDVHVVKARVEITGGTVGRSSALEFTPTVQGVYGLVVDGSDRYTVTGVTAGGSTGNFQFLNNPASNYRGRLAKDNKSMPGMSPNTRPDYETFVTTVIVSGNVYTNTSPYVWQAFVSGDTVSGAATITLNGTQVSARSEWSGLMNPGDALIVTTAVACTLRTVPLP